LFYSVICFEDKRKDKRASLENQTKPNPKAPAVLESAFLTTLSNYYLTRSECMSDSSIKKKEYESVL